MESLFELEADIDIMLRILKVPFKQRVLVKDVSSQFVAEDFGVVVSAINRSDYAFILRALQEELPGYRYVFISPHDDMVEAKDELIFALMQSGYMKYIRTNFSRQFTDLVSLQNLDRKIIDERLKRWGDEPKYRYLVEENKMARGASATMILATEPGFYDYMP